MVITDRTAAGHGGPNPSAITVTVNNHEVVFQERHSTGSEIKSTAISQGVVIQQDFVLYEVKGQGRLDPIGDEDRVTLHPNQEFRALTPDDTSGGWP